LQEPVGSFVLVVERVKGAHENETSRSLNSGKAVNEVQPKWLDDRLLFIEGLCY
jgi:hypothetical protein